MITDDNKISVLKSFISNFIKEEFFIDVINVGLYPSQFNTVGFSNENNLTTFVKKFFGDLIKSCKHLGISNIKQLQTYINLSTSILNTKDTNASIINYDNVLQHLISPDIAQQKIIQTVLTNKINTIEEFQKKVEQINTNIQIFYEVQSISGSISLLDNFMEMTKKPNTVIETLKLFKESVISVYNELSKLQSLNKIEAEKDYFIISDRASITKLTSSVVDYISQGYSLFKTGYNFIDGPLEGIESSSVHVFAAPSNHGKSLFKLNLLMKIITNNINEFNKDDGILFVTLEDDKFKLKRRLCSIFGNVDFALVKSLYSKSYEVLKNRTNKQPVLNKISSVMDDLIFNCIYARTNGKIKLIVKYAPENTFSVGDLSKFVDVLKVENTNIVLTLEDYIDVKAPTLSNYSQFNDYDIHGLVVQEQRSFTRRYKMPLITSTQLKRGSDNMSFPLDTSMIGDSIKKYRYADFLYLFRQDSIHTVFDSEVVEYVTEKSSRDKNGTIIPSIRTYYDIIKDDLIPIEIKMDKSKDSDKRKNGHSYLVMSKRNLRVYNTIEEYLKDLPELESNTSKLKKSINEIVDYTVTSIINDFDI